MEERDRITIEREDKEEDKKGLSWELKSREQESV